MENRPPLQASKWLTSQVLLSAEELKNLLSTTGSWRAFITGRMVDQESEEIPLQQFYEEYRTYLEQIAAGSVGDFRARFAFALTQNSQDLCRYAARGIQYILRPWRPIVQVQLHRFRFSALDYKLHSMVHGEDCISWGLQLSYPTQYLDSETGQVVLLNRQNRLPNTVQFTAIQRALRSISQPIALFFEGKKILSSIRVGKEAVDLARQHYQLVAQRLVWND